MAWRDRLRRRAAVPEAATAAPAARNTAAAPETGVPGDWDGGWRTTAPPTLTVSRAAIGVSDGLAFRSGLAAWHDPSFDTGLAHSLLPSAPAGLVRGVARPAGPRSAPGGGGPLLLRALRQPHEADPPGADAAPLLSRQDRPDAGPSGATPPRPGGSATGPVVSVPPVPVRDSVPPSPSASREGASPHSTAVLGTPAPAVQRAGATGSRAAVAPGAPGRAPTPPRFPVVRRVAVVPDASAARGASAGPPAQRAAVRPSGAGGTSALTEPARSASAVVRPRAVGRTLTVARVPAPPRRRVPAIRPVPARTAPVTTTAVQRAEGRAPLGAPDVGTPVRGVEGRAPLGAADAGTPAQGAGSRAPLGAALSGLPATATASDRTATAPAPAMPVVQRRAEPATDGGATSRSGGPGPAAQPRAEKPAAPAKPMVQRQAEPSAQRGAVPTADPGTPMQRTGSRPPLGAAPASALPVVQRRAEPGSGTPKASPERRAEKSSTQAKPMAEGGMAPDSDATPNSSGPKPTAQRRAEPATGPGAPVQRTGSRPPLGAPLTELPTTAVPSDRAAAAPLAAPALPVVQRQAEPTAKGGASPDGSGPKPTAQRHAEPAAGPGAPVQRTGSRPPLGAPLTELPTTALPSGHAAAAPAPAPALPVVQRQAEPSAGGAVPPDSTGPRLRPGTPTEATRGSGPGRSAPRVRTGLGAPLPSLPPSAALPASATHRSRAARSASPADVQRAPAPGAPSTPTPTPTGQAPVLGAGVPRPAAVYGAPMTGGPGAPRGAAHPIPLVVARSVTDKTAGDAAAPAVAPRTLQLLADRPLPVGTGDMGSAAAPAPRQASRPVVAARWPAPSAPQAAAPGQVQRTADGQRGTTTPTPARPSGSVSRGHSPRPAHTVRPAVAPVAAAPLPVTGVHAPPLVVQPSVAAASPARPVPVVRPRTPFPAVSPPATGTAPPASTPLVQRDTGGGRSTPGPVRVQTAAAAPATRGNRRPATASAPGTTAAGRHERSRDAVPQGGDLDLDDLARRLLDPVARLLRTELRRGRERAGRPFDGRR